MIHVLFCWCRWQSCTCMNSKLVSKCAGPKFSIDVAPTASLLWRTVCILLQQQASLDSLPLPFLAVVGGLSPACASSSTCTCTSC